MIRNRFAVVVATGVTHSLDLWAQVTNSNFTAGEYADQLTVTVHY